MADSKEFYTTNWKDMVMAEGFLTDIDKVLWSKAGKRDRASDPDRTVKSDWAGDAPERARLDTIPTRRWLQWSNEGRREVLEDQFATLIFKEVKGVRTLVILEEETPPTVF